MDKAKVKTKGQNNTHSFNNYYIYRTPPVSGTVLGAGTVAVKTQSFRPLKLEYVQG